MTLSTFYTTESLAQFQRGWPLFRLSKRAADRASLTMDAKASRTIATQMSQQGLGLLRERFDRLATATTPDERQAVYADIREKAERIDYAREVP